jgi:hypothetical protein
MRHQDLTFNHRLESWIFANAAARNAAGSYVAGDVGRIAYTSDSADYWRLLTTAPTWKRLNGAYAAFQTPQPALNPASTTSTTGVMAGLGAVITPTVTGKILVIIAGTLGNAVAGKIPGAALRYGTGTPPVNGAAPTGTAIGAVEILTGNTVNNASPFSLAGVIINAVIGVALWLDLLQSTASGGTTALTNVSVSAVELP